MKRINQAYIHEQTHISGEVTLGANVNVWPFASIRGDVTPEEIQTTQTIAERYVQLAQDHLDGKYPDYS